MKILKIITVSALLCFFITPANAYAATSPSLGLAKTFSILSGTYSNTVSGTTINGDLGYTVPPATAPTVNGNTHIVDPTYNQAGIDQNTALTALSSQACSFTFSPGNIDLATDTTHGPVGVFTPGVYCINGAADIGGGGTITFNGAGAYIFLVDGAVTSTANSVVALTNGATACDVWWAPTAATTLGANSTFAGTDIDASGITIGNNVTWMGRALAFGGTVSTDSDTISTPACNTTQPTPSPTDTSGTDAAAQAAAAARAAQLAASGQNNSLILGSSAFILVAGLGLAVQRHRQ